eukprot:UN02130
MTCFRKAYSIANLQHDWDYATVLEYQQGLMEAIGFQDSVENDKIRVTFVNRRGRREILNFEDVRKRFENDPSIELSPMLFMEDYKPEEQIKVFRGKLHDFLTSTLVFGISLELQMLLSAPMGLQFSVGHS